MLCHFDTLFYRIGDTLFVYRKCDDKSAVLFDKGKDRGHDLILTVHGIDHRLAVICTKRRLHRHRIRGIKLERKIRHRLKFPDGLRKKLWLVDIGYAYINIEYMDILIGLAQSLVKDMIHVMLDESLLETLLSCRVDALSDKYRIPVKVNGMCVRAYDGKSFIRYRYRLKTPLGNKIGDLLNILGSRSAASSDHTHSRLHLHDDFLGELIDRNVKNGLAVLDSRKPGIRLENNGHGCFFKKLLHYTAKLFRSDRAVRSDRIGSHPFEHRSHCRRIGTRHELAVCIKSIGDYYRKIAVLLDRKKGCLCLEAVIHRLYRHKIRSGSNTCLYRLCKRSDRILEIE